MTVRKLRLDCERALDLLMARGPYISEKDSGFLQSHLSTCPSCFEQSLTVDNAVRAMRQDVMYASPVMVRATQLRVRARAAELRAQQETMRPLWIASALALGWAGLSMPLMWQGFSWLGHTTHAPDVMWQSLFGFMALMPITAVATIGAAKFRLKAAK